MFDNVREVWTLTQGSRAHYAAAITAMVVASCFLYLAPLIPQAVIDGVLLGASDAPLVAVPLALLGGPAYVGGHLWVAALASIALTAAAGIATYLRSRWSAAASEAVVRALRDRVFDHLQRLPIRYFDRAQTGDLIQRCTSDVETLRVFLANHVVEIGRSLIMFLVPLPVMIALHPQMTAISVVLMPAIVLFSTVFFLRVRSAFEEADEAEGALTTSIQENLTGIRVVRAFGRSAHEEARFAERNSAYRGRDYRVYRLMALFWSVSDLMTFAQKSLVVGAGVYWVWQDQLAVGAFFYFLTAVGMFMYPLRQMGRIVADLGKATVAVGRLREILDHPVESDPADAVQLFEPEGALSFEDVTFRHDPDGPPAIDGLSLEIPARSTVAFIGASGAGKTTLVSLLLRLYDPDEGTVRLDGHDLRALDRTALRQQLAVVMQRPFLYSRSVAENLLLGRHDAHRDELIEATCAADVHDTIERFDRGYDTTVGEGGVTLSGGQRQRVALARALLQRPPEGQAPPAVLVLDDALSAVDTETEAAILERLRQRRGRQTTLIIAHRLSTVALADQIFVLDEGRLVQQGDHASLLAQRGPYAELWRSQTEAAQHDSSSREAS